eukprot:789513-Pelagomonas_calceolata.AAC.7
MCPISSVTTGQCNRKQAAWLAAALPLLITAGYGHGCPDFPQFGKPGCLGIHQLHGHGQERSGCAAGAAPQGHCNQREQLHHERQAHGSNRNCPGSALAGV